MMKKIFLTIIMLFVATTAFAMHPVENSDEILNEMLENPSRYIRYGGESVGFSFYMDKETINVHKYAPPQYIIAVRHITYHDNGMINENRRVSIVSEKLLCYAYDYDARKMYVESRDKNGKLFWKLIDPAKSKTYHDDNWVAAGEIMFYLAYNMSFYDKPATKTAENVIIGKPSFFRGTHI